MNGRNINEPDNCGKLVACFRDLTTEELEQINRGKTELTYLAGENLFKQGAFSTHLLLITSGLVKVYLQTGREKQLNLQLAQTGDFLGFASLFGETVHATSAVALTDTEVCMIDKEQMRNILLNNAQFAMRITSRNYRNERQLLTIIANMTYKQMRGKLASTLLYLSGENFSDQNLFQYLSRQDLANFASVATESAIKLLKEFERDGIIALEGKGITILNKTELEKIERLG
ncbi:MAG TPA: Crp/Fnr family transcriptional regulator [Proteiniphilum sp.]|nr:Crp/Fnr family transcriptional regulator [Proteiniphilum sp.]HPJ50567.1 Crp/Fnr family transcriptional regulator [Proteiniphilum sp.]HPR20984.1 Crp/Fnr family transcriptional regulator [Proteiniphilum sp.]